MVQSLLFGASSLAGTRRGGIAPGTASAASMGASAAQPFD
jgi:hypothetical protein